MSRFLRTTSHFAMQSGIAANSIVKEKDHGLWMRREKVHGFGGYGHAFVIRATSDAGVTDAHCGARDGGAAWDGAGDPADAAEDRLIP